MKNDNELIAEFMDYDHLRRRLKSHLLDGYTQEQFYESLSFHDSWDWLMPVVDKIDKLTLLNETYFRTTIGGSRNRTHCYIYKYTPGASVGKEVSEGHENSKINAVYKAVVEFIKWYNQNK